MRRYGEDGSEEDGSEEDGSEEDGSDGQDGRPGPGKGDRRRGVSLAQVLAVIAVILLIIFSIANSRRVDVNFLFFSARARVVTVIVLSAILGFFIGYYVGRPGRADRKLLRELRERRD